MLFTWVRREWLQLKTKWRSRDGRARRPNFNVLAVSPACQIGWGLQALNVPDLWKQTKGSGVKVGIVDTGVDLTHPDLVDGIVASADFTGKGTAQDGDGHGTHVAGIIGARGISGGTVGAAPECQLYIAKALGDDGSGDYGAITEALEWCIQQKVDVINMSLGGPQDDYRLHDAIRTAVNQGIVVVCAAGNDGVDAIDDVDYPGRYDEAIAVGALDPQLHLASYSSVGPEVDILAPGSQVYSTYPGGNYALLSGTSMATPFVSGVVALAIAKAKIDGKPITGMRDLLLKHALPRPDLAAGNMGYAIIDPADVFTQL